jgi:transcriptional regulator with XRE-family HTH domain
MKNRGLTMRALSLELGVPYTTLQGWMTGGKFPRPDTYDRITQWLDAEVE